MDTSSNEELLLRRGADPVVCNVLGFNALNLVASHGYGSSVLRMLARLSTVPDLQAAPDSRQRTPLHVACPGGHEDKVRMMESRFNCDPHAVCKAGRSAVHYASQADNPNLVCYLVDELGGAYSK